MNADEDEPKCARQGKAPIGAEMGPCVGLSSSKILREVVGAKNPPFITAMVKREGLLEAQSVLGWTFYMMPRQGLQALCNSLPHIALTSRWTGSTRRVHGRSSTMSWPSGG